MIRQVAYAILILMLIFGIVMAAASLRYTLAVGPSMEPTIHTGQLLLVRKYYKEPQVGDVVMILRPDGEQWIKRITAIAGETVDGQQIPADHVFVTGDNLDNSYDSRDVGPIPLSQCWGRVLLRERSK